MEEVRTTIKIAGRQYPVLLTESEAIHSKSIEVEINNKVSEMKSQYADFDSQDCLALLLLNAKMDFLSSTNSSDDEETLELINDIESILT